MGSTSESEIQPAVEHLQDVLEAFRQELVKAEESGAENFKCPKALKLIEDRDATIRTVTKREVKFHHNPG